MDLSKQQALDADPTAIQQIHFTANLERAEGATMFFIIEQSKSDYFWIFTRNRKSFVNVV